MALNLAWDALINAGSGLVLIIFGVWVLTLNPRSRPIVGLALHAVAIGTFFLVWKVLPKDHPLHMDLLYRVVMSALVLTALAGLLLVALRLPAPVGREDRGSVMVAGGIGAAWSLLPVFFPFTSGIAEVVPLEAYLAHALQAGLLFVLFLLALRHAWARGAEGAAQRGQLRFMSLALVLYPAAAFGHGAVQASRIGWVGLGLVVVLAVIWLGIMARARAAEVRGCRTVALVGLATALVSALIVVLFGTTFSDAGGPHWGVARMVGVLILGLAILRHQLLGLDVKVRWTISKSTVAAVFIAVFFITSEAASQFFGDRFNNNYIGIGAAGLLVLGIAPLQRFADRVATKAIPVRTTDDFRGEASEIYQRQVKNAWADGRISTDERKMLRSLRKDLGLSLDDADLIEEQVEAGLSGKLH